MVGKLAVSFCERQAGESCLCIDLWSYPDGTCNLVVSSMIGLVDHELAFPCAPYQLDLVTSGQPLRIIRDEGSIVVDWCDGEVRAKYTSHMSGRCFRQCIALEEYRNAVDLLMTGTVGYLA